MAPNPLPVAVSGNNLPRRTRTLRRLFSILLTDARQLLGTCRAYDLVRVLAWADSPHCLPTWRTWCGYFPVVFKTGWRAPLLGRWLASWARRDLKVAHSHLGPVAV